MATTETKLHHTPLPWVIDGASRYGKIKTPTRDTLLVDGVAVPMTADAEAEANAAFIVQACNSFYALRDALEKIAKRAAIHPDDDCDDHKRMLYHIQSIAERALANGEQAK